MSIPNGITEIIAQWARDRYRAKTEEVEVCAMDDGAVFIVVTQAAKGTVTAIMLQIVFSERTNP